MPNLSIKSVPEELAESLRQRAARNHRSLQGELMAILEAAVAASSAPSNSSTQAKTPAASFGAAADAFRKRFSAPLGDSMDSTAIVREMRDTHYGEAWAMGRIKDGHWPPQAGDSDPLPEAGPIHKVP